MRRQEWLRALAAQGGPTARTIKNLLHGTWLDPGGARQAADPVLTLGVVSLAHVTTSELVFCRIKAPGVALPAMAPTNRHKFWTNLRRKRTC